MTLNEKMNQAEVLLRDIRSSLAVNDNPENLRYNTYRVECLCNQTRALRKVMKQLDKGKQL